MVREVTSVCVLLQTGAGGPRPRRTNLRAAVLGVVPDVLPARGEEAVVQRRHCEVVCSEVGRGRGGERVGWDRLTLPPSPSLSPAASRNGCDAPSESRASATWLCPIASRNLSSRAWSSSPVAGQHALTLTSGVKPSARDDGEGGGELLGDGGAERDGTTNGRENAPSRRWRFSAGVALSAAAEEDGEDPAAEADDVDEAAAASPPRRGAGAPEEKAKPPTRFLRVWIFEVRGVG
jgi:hypothetical protein